MRLRSLSDEDEKASLEWQDIIPSSVQLFDINDESGTDLKNNEVVVPSKDFIIFKVIW